MDLPVSIATNFHKIDDVPEINWIVFTHTHRQAVLPNLGSDQNSLYSVESNYRQAGGYIYREAQTDRLWVFHWPRQGKDGLIDSSYHPAKAPGISEVIRGVICPLDSVLSYHAPDNAETGTKRKRSDDTSGLLRLNQHAVSQNFFISIPSKENKLSEEPPKDDHIRSCLLRAIQMSYLLILTQDHKYLPLGKDYFFKWPSQIDRGLTISQSYRQRGLLSLWSLKAIWHTNGALLLSYHQVKNRFVCIPAPEASDKEVILAPFGWLAKMNVESTSDSTLPPGSISERKLNGAIQWRYQCSRILHEYGLELKNDVGWVSVSMLSNYPDEVIDITEWPKELCFRLADSSYNQEQKNQRQPSSTLTGKDPLAEADAWFKDRKVREALIKEQLQARLKPSEHDLAQGGEEVPSHLQSRYEETVDQQILAGIYPTPPDASKIHPNIRSDGNTRMLGYLEDSDAIDLKDEFTDYTTPALGGNVDIANYNPLKDNELFTDLDSDMDGVNGITEDDFRFFDEPDDPDITTAESVLPDLINLEEIREESREESRRESRIESQDMEEEEELLDERLPSSIANEDAEQEITTPHSEHRVQIASSPIVHIYDEVVAISPRINGVQHLDAKYTSTGKYAWRHSQQPSTPNPIIPVEQEKKIPRLNVKPVVATATITGSEPLHKPEPLFNPLPFRQDSISSVPDTRDLDTYFKACLYFDPKKPSDAVSKGNCLSSDSVPPGMLENQDHAFIQLAQIVADQSIYYEYILERQNHSDHADVQDEDLQNINYILANGQIDDRVLNLQEFTLPGSGSAIAIDSPTVLATSTMRVKRGESIMDMSFTAIEYWRELGLKPLHDTKSITAFCLYPNTEAYHADAAKFLHELGDAYRNLNLGSHLLGDAKLPSYLNGLVPILGLEALAIDFKSLQGYCSQFGSSLVSLEGIQSTVMIYIIKPIEGNISLMEICALFQQIVEEAYTSPFRKLGQPSGIILQIIPSSLILSGLTQILPCLKQYSNIAKIVYDRCPPKKPLDSAYASGSMIQLAEALPTIIDFKLNLDSLAHPVRTPETFHLAYACTTDRRWLSMALIDTFGSKQWSAAYYLGDHSDFIPALAEIAREIFEIVQDAADSKSNYSLVIVKTIKWTPSEIEIWKQLAHKAKISLSMVVYDLQCPLRVLDPSMRLGLEPLDHGIPSTLSIQDPSSLDAGIPRSEEQANCTRLINNKDQAYWFLSNEVLATDDSCLIIQQHLASGYLIYKNQPLVSIYVQDSTHAVDIISIVKAYHDLKTLSRARCVHDDLPWHLAVADTARSGVERNMNSRVAD